MKKVYIVVTHTGTYLSKIIKELVSVLERVGAEKMLKRGLNSYSVDVDMFSCDLSINNMLTE